MMETDSHTEIQTTKSIFHLRGFYIITNITSAGPLIRHEVYYV